MRRQGTTPSGRTSIRSTHWRADARAPVGLRDIVPSLTQADCQFDPHLPSNLVGRRVVPLMQLRQEPESVLEHPPAGVDQGLVLVEVQIRVQPRHDDADPRLADLIAQVGHPDRGLVPRPDRQQHHVHMAGLFARTAHLNASTITPAPTIKIPTHSCTEGRSPRKITAMRTTSSRLSLSTGATFEASPIFSARK